MRRFFAFAGSAVIVLVVLVLTAAVVSLFIPTGEYRGIPAQPMQLPGSPVTDVYAVAVAGPDTTWGMLYLERAGWMTGAASTQHSTDEAAAKSRTEAWAAANLLMGTAPKQWTATSRDDSTVQVLDNVQCRKKTGNCTAMLLEGSLDGVTYDEAVKVTFAEPPAGTLTPVNDVAPESLPKAETLGGWSGGSAGLAYTLTYVEYLTGQSITPPGVRVAATGGIAVTPGRDTEVLQVDAVPEKMVSALLSDVDVLFVPVGQAAGEAGGMRVVEVATVNDAVRWLCDNGAYNELCYLPGSTV